MLLVADAGNTDICFGVFVREAILADARVDSGTSRTPAEYEKSAKALLAVALAKKADGGTIEGVCIASVVPRVTDGLVAMAARLGVKAVVLTGESPVGMAMEVDRPAEVGPDRIANALAARARHAGASVIADFGTATTLTVVNAGGAFGGGAICAGLKTSIGALAAKAARLSVVEAKAPPGAIGKNTVHAIQSGAVLGQAAMVDGLVARMESELGVKARVFFTGGLSGLVSPWSKRVDETLPFLTLEGLRVAWGKLKRRE